MKTVFVLGALVALTGCRTIRPRAEQQPSSTTEQSTGQVQQPIDSQQSQTSSDSGKKKPNASDVSHPTTQ